MLYCSTRLSTTTVAEIKHNIILRVNLQFYFYYYYLFFIQRWYVHDGNRKVLVVIYVFNLTAINSDREKPRKRREEEIKTLISILKDVFGFRLSFLYIRIIRIITSEILLFHATP